MTNHMKFFVFLAFVLSMAAAVVTVPFMAADFVHSYFGLDRPVATWPENDDDTGLGH